ncbi:MAG: SPOR domain-containing protein [Burkholderiales bacterium]
MPPTADANLDELKRKARRRLVGAVVLALAAAVFVPMLLESDERPLGDDVAVRIPSVDQGKFVNRINSPGGGDKGAPAKAAPAPAAPSPVTAPGSGGDAGAAGTAPAAANPVAATRDAPVASAAAPAPTADAAAPKASAAPSKAAAELAAKAVATPKPATGGDFVVQLAAFADDKGANSLATRLKKSGHPAFTEPVTTSHGTLWRVRVGPYATRDEANTARDQLKREGQNGIVAARSS